MYKHKENIGPFYIETKIDYIWNLLNFQTKT